MQKVFMVSGGRTSAMMAVRYSSPGDILLFTDTGREHPATYSFLDDLEKYIGNKIHRVHNKETFSQLCSRKKAVPNITWRFCTQELKIRASKRYLRQLGIQRFEKYIGFRADERQRVSNHRNNTYEKKVVTRFPLADDGIYNQDVLTFWMAMPFDLTIPHILGNCDLCPLKGKEKLVTILRHHPEYASKWIADEDATGHTYIKGISYRELLNVAQTQTSLFPPALDNLSAHINCSCGHFF